MRYKHIFVLIVLLSAGLSDLFSQQVTYDWKHVIQSNQYSALCCMAMDSSGNMYFGGRLDSTIAFVDTTVTNTWSTGFLAKFTSDGDMVWFKQFEHSESVYAICFDSENNLYISGSYYGKVRIDDTLLYTWDVDTTYFGMFLAKFDTDGTCLWAKTTAGTFYYESDYAKLKQMTIDKDDNLVVVSYTIKEYQYYDVTTPYTKTLDSAWVTTPYPHWVYYYARTNVLVKFNKDGQKLWIKDLGKHQQHYLAIAADYSNNILLTGYFWDDYPFVVDSLTLNASGGENIFIIKYNPNGQLMWAQRGGGASNGPNKAFDIISDDNNNVYLSGIVNGGNIEFGGITQSPGGTKHMFLIKYNSFGTVEWFNHYGTEISANTFDYSLGLSYKNNEIFLCGFFYDSLKLGYEILNSFYPTSYASGIFIRFNTNGDLIDAAMDQEIIQSTPIYFYNGLDSYYYVAGNLLSYSNYEDCIFFGRFPKTYLVNNPEVYRKHNKYVVFPNPCSEYLTVFYNTEHSYLFEIFDITGKLYLSQTISSNPCQINISFIPKGVYLVKVENYVSKLIVK